MDINDHVMTALKGLEEPVRFGVYTGSEKTCITFFEYTERPIQHTDDNISNMGHYIQLDIWSKEDYTELVQKTMQLMKDAAFSFINGASFYEEDAKVYHKALRYIKSIREE